MNLPKVKKRKKKRVGRGFGSGRGGHTASRGTKGQKSRSKVGILFEGVKVKKSLLKRLPLQRGKGRLKAKPKPIIIKLDYLNIFPAKSKVDINALVKKGIIRDKDKHLGVKILGGKLEKELHINLPTSKSAAKQIEKLKGKITN